MPFTLDLLPSTVTFDSRPVLVYNEPVRFQERKEAQITKETLKSNVRKRLAATWLQYMAALQEGRKRDATTWRAILGYDRMTLEMLNNIKGNPEI